MLMRSRYLWLFVGFFALTLIFSPAADAGVQPKIVAGYYHSLMLKADGSLWSWGGDLYGELGREVGVTWRDIPGQVGSATNWVAVAAGCIYTLGVKADGSLWAWGYNAQGQLGLGDTNERYTPVQVGTATDWVVVAAGDFHSLALKADGSLYAWGRNDSGQLGLGDTTNHYTPTYVGTGYVAVAGAQTHSLGIKADGSLWAWGSNSSGQLGLGDFDISWLSPVQVGTATNWVAVAAGNGYSLGLKVDGTLWAWGANNDGQLGLGDIANRNIPTNVGAGWVMASGYLLHSLGLKVDGTLWAIGGANDCGQLGLGSIDSKPHSNPIQVGLDANWVAVVAGYNHSLGLKADGSLWAWGWNAYSQLGLGDSNDRNSPTQIQGFYPKNHKATPALMLLLN